MPRAGHVAPTSSVCARRGKARTTDTPTHDPDTRQSRRLLYSYFQAGPGTDPPARLQRSSSEASSLAALHRTCSRTARHSAAVCESEGCPRHLRRPSYRSWSIPCSGGRSEGPILRPARVALLTNRKDVLTAAHLFDARRTLPLHSCQGPQRWGTGRTSGMK